MTNNRWLMGGMVMLAALVGGQVLAYLINPSGYLEFLDALRVVLSQVAFWGPLVGLLAGAISFGALRLLGFQSLDEIRQESVEQNNPTPAIVFVGTLIASLLLLSVVIRP